MSARPVLQQQQKLNLNFSVLDPDPEFWPNWDPDPGLCYQFWKKTLNFFIEKTNLIFLNKIIRKYCHVTWRNVSWVSELWIYFLNPILYASILWFYPSIFTCVDTDPQSTWIRTQYGSGSTTLVMWRSLTEQGVESGRLHLIHWLGELLLTQVQELNQEISLTHHQDIGSLFQLTSKMDKPAKQQKD